MLDERAVELAGDGRRQLGLHTRQQAIAAGYTEDEIDDRLARGIWEPWALRVYAPPGLPRTWHRQLLAAILSTGGGAAASRRSSAAMWGLQRKPAVPSLVVPYRHRGPISLDAIEIHRSRTLTPEDVALVDSIPCTVADRAIADLSLEEGVGRVRELIARALHRDVTDGERLARRADLIRGKPGGSVFRRALASLMDGAERARSHPELDLAERIVDSGLPRPEIGYEVREEDGRLVAEIDLAYPWCKLAIEVDGFVWHSTPDRKRYDEVRQNRLTLRGWRVLRFSVEDIRQRPEWVVRQIAAALSGS